MLFALLEVFEYNTNGLTNLKLFYFQIDKINGNVNRSKTEIIKMLFALKELKHSWKGIKFWYLPAISVLSSSSSCSRHHDSDVAFIVNCIRHCCRCCCEYDIVLSNLFILYS